jgi:hypothetical protein
LCGFELGIASGKPQFPKFWISHFEFSTNHLQLKSFFEVISFSNIISYGSRSAREVAKIRACADAEAAESLEVPHFEC